MKRAVCVDCHCQNPPLTKCHDARRETDTLPFCCRRNQMLKVSHHLQISSVQNGIPAQQRADLELQSTVSCIRVQALYHSLLHGVSVAWETQAHL